MRDDEDWRAEMAELRAEDREAQRAQACRCGGDMPGRCPGPAHCPMCEPDVEDDK